MQVKKQQLEPDMEQQTGFKLVKEYDALYRLYDIVHIAGVLSYL